ncbi:MAG: Stk1 family PASTA domain-containing Ser/Thr kinase [Acidimicrobiales bacterium]
MSQQTVFNGRYELHRRIARGGMADVFLARDQLLDRPVAVKVLFPEYATDPTFVTRFRREAQAAANLNHPNIVSDYDWGQEETTYFIVMEYVDGRSLADIVRSEGPLHPDRGADVAADIAAALGFAHRNGVIHRDVKPGNVLIAPSGVVKVADFGIARAIDAVDENLTQTGSVMGTATYFSPEQAQGLALDPRSDLYSLGIVLYESVTGRAPFSGDSPVAVAYKHVQEKPQPPRDINPDVPRDLDAIILQLLAKNPAARYASAEDLRADLRRFRQRQPVLAAGAGAATAATVAAAPTRAVPSATTATPATRAVPTTDGYTHTGVAEPAYYGDRDYTERRRTGWFVVAIILLLAILAGLVFLLVRTLGDDDTPNAVLVDVPSVVNQPEADARATLEGLGFEVVSQPEENDQVEQGIVFAQSPEAGTRLEERSTVTIRVSAGANTIPMPDVVGSTFDRAVGLLEGRGFTNITRNDQPDPDAPVNEVIGQDPAADTDVPLDTAIVLTVSSGPPKVPVPSVAGRTEADASNLLGRAGFNVTVRRQASATVPAGTAIGTNPPEGTELDEDAQVELIVSSGPEQVAVPDVRGDTQQEATSKLTAAGLRVKVDEANDHDTDFDVGEVVDQEPDGGNQVAPNTEVTIFLNPPPD